MEKMTKNLIIVGMALMSFFSIQAVTPGNKVSDFRLQDYNGREFRLSQFKDKSAIVVIFVSTRCPVSNAYNQRMAQIFADYSPKNVAVIGINSNRGEDAEAVKKHAAENGLKFPILMDENNEVADLFGAKVTPEVFVLEPDLTVRYHGHIDDSQRESQVKKSGLRDALDELLANKAVTDSETKAFGCSIKRVRE